jgi:peptide/nickel transport system permease protein
MLPRRGNVSTLEPVLLPGPAGRPGSGPSERATPRARRSIPNPVPKALRNDTAGTAAAALLVVLVAACFLAPALFGLAGPNSGSLGSVNLPLGSPGHLLGTDSLGNDLLSRSLFGGRVSFEVSLGAVAIGVIVGESIGMAAAFFGGLVETVLMRITDVLVAIPAIVLALAISAFLGPSEADEIIAISFFTVPGLARLTRSVTEGFCLLPVIPAATLGGTGRLRMLVRHVLPNVFPETTTFILVSVANAMVVSAALGFLGAGVRPPTPSWGNMIAAAVPDLAQHPAEVFVPAAFLFASVFLMNLVADAARRASR